MALFEYITIFDIDMTIVLEEKIFVVRNGIGIGDFDLLGIDSLGSFVAAMIRVAMVTQRILIFR